MHEEHGLILTEDEMEVIKAAIREDEKQDQKAAELEVSANMCPRKDQAIRTDCRKKTLHLTLKKKWFDLILHGQKKREYREGKEYWRRRLLGSEGFAIKFDEVMFRNGYGASAPWVLVEWKGLGIIGGSDGLSIDVHGEEVNNGDFSILLGEVLASGN